MNTRYDKAVVIGAGIAGLTAAWKLAKAGMPVVLIEKEQQPGGLSATFDWDGWKFDYGPHNFHSYDDSIISFYQELMGDMFIPRTPKCQVYIFDKLVTYPLVGADVLLALNGRDMVRAATDFLLTRTRAFLFGIRETEYVDEWIIRRFGKVLYNLYFGPYIKRLWNTDPHRLSKILGEQKIPILSIRNYIKREIFQRKEIQLDHALTWKTFYVRSGIGAIAEKYVHELKKMPHVRIVMNGEVDTIHVKDGRVTAIDTRNESIDTSAGVVVSTIPIRNLIQSMPDAAQQMKTSAELLEYNSIRFFFVRTRKAVISGNDYCYFSDDKYCFNRVSEFNYDQFGMVPEKNHSSLAFEVPANESDWTWNLSDRELMEHILPLYNSVFNLTAADIIDYRSEYQKYAYPRFVIGFEKAVKEIFGFMQGLSNLYSIGRQGMFCYLNVDGATRMGIDTAKLIVEGTESREALRTLLKRYHKIDI